MVIFEVDYVGMFVVNHIDPVIEINESIVNFVSYDLVVHIEKEVVVIIDEDNKMVDSMIIIGDQIYLLVYSVKVFVVDEVDVIIIQIENVIVHIMDNDMVVVGIVSCIRSMVVNQNYLLVVLVYNKEMVDFVQKEVIVQTIL